jgi:hypothetical protein
MTYFATLNNPLFGISSFCWLSYLVFLAGHQDKVFYKDRAQQAPTCYHFSHQGIGGHILRVDRDCIMATAQMQDIGSLTAGHE